MSQGLRMRRPNSDNKTDLQSSPSIPSSVGLTRSSLLRASPQEHGSVQKLRVPFFYSILPFFLQKLVSRLRFLAYFLAPRWESRYLILLGSYLYKFADLGSQSNHRDEKPKGSPLDVDALDAYVLQDGDSYQSDYGIRVTQQSLPQGFAAVFCVSTFRKKYFYAVKSREQAMMWVNSLLQAKEEAVRLSMGHAHPDSYPKSWAYYDGLGRNMQKQKDRIRTRVQEKNLQELEMSRLAEGGPIPRGYYG